jgi:hypothetical protein
MDLFAEPVRLVGAAAMTLGAEHPCTKAVIKLLMFDTPENREIAQGLVDDLPDQIRDRIVEILAKPV